MTEPPPGVALLMFLAYRDAESRIVEKIREAGFDDVTLAQARVCARVGPEGTRITDLAAQAQVTKQSASVLVDALERAGYVERRADPADARVRRVHLTARAHRVQEVARAAEAEIEEQWTRHLGAHRMQQLRAALTGLREITDPWAPVTPAP